jgi:hypothetical protein
MGVTCRRLRVSSQWRTTRSSEMAYFCWQTRSDSSDYSTVYERSTQWTTYFSCCCCIMFKNTGSTTSQAARRSLFTTETRVQDSYWTKWHCSNFFQNFLCFPCQSSFLYCSILIHHHPMRCATALIKQYIISTLAPKSGFHLCLRTWLIFE